VAEIVEVHRKRRDVLVDGLNKIGWNVPKPKGTMFVWAPIPEPYAEMTSLEFTTMVVQEAKVALSPGNGFGPGGEGFVRFALIENEQRIGQAVRSLRRGLDRLPVGSGTR
jgi:alanine-synthesizing transaminase